MAIHSWKIGNVEIPNRVVVAPMAGITNAAFRVTVKEFGAGLVVCEMISDRGIQLRNKKTLEMLYIDETEHPLSLQIFGGNKESLVEAAQFVSENTAADIIDINMGCPVNKIIKAEAGAKWLLDPDKVYEMVHAVATAIETGELIAEPTPREKIATAKLHLERLADLKGEFVASREFRQHAAYYLKGISRAAKVKAAINQTENKQAIIDLLDAFVEKTEKQPVGNTPE